MLKGAVVRGLAVLLISSAGFAADKKQKESKRSDESFRLLRASLVIGEQVANVQAKEVGDVQDLVMDAAQRRTPYVVINVGSYLGGADKLIPVPWQALTTEKPAKADQDFVLDLDKQQMQEAKSIDPASPPDMADFTWGRDIHSFYGQQPYWERNMSSLRGEPISNEKPSIWRRKSRSQQVRTIEIPKPLILRVNEEVIGHGVKHASNGEKLGEIHDLLLDHLTGDVAFVAVRLDRNTSATRTDPDKIFVILPIQMFSFDRQGNPNAPYTIECCLIKLREHRITGAGWPDLTSRSWAKRLYSDFGRTPYWE